MIVAILQTSALSEPEFLAFEQSSRMRCSPSPKYGPQLARRYADTLRRPRHAKVKEQDDGLGPVISTLIIASEGVRYLVYERAMRHSMW
jgi:hypothetical protein